MRGHVTEGEGKQEEYREKSKQESDCTCVTMKAAPWPPWGRLSKNSLVLMLP